jgi:AraC family transcriptional regulator
MADRLIFETSTVALGRFRCEPDDDLWRQPNRIAYGPVVAFPQVPVRIRQEGRWPVVCTPNGAVLYNAKQVYTRERVDDTGDVCTWIHVAPHAMRDVLAASDPSARDREDARLFCTDHVAVGSDVFLRQRLLFERGIAAGDRLAIEETALSLIARLTAAAVAPTAERPAVHERTSAAHRDLAQGTIEFLAQNFRRGLSLDQIASAVGASPFHLCRVFRRQTRDSIHVFANRLRLRWATDRVLAGRVSLTQAGLQAGFSSSAHFSTAFHREFGVTPLCVRLAGCRSGQKASTILKALLSRPYDN